jgi:small subunit ribosomal protein S2
MKEITLEELLEAGCHFGHQVTRSNPKARDFVFEARDNIQIIDLAKTKEGLDEAAQFAKALGLRGGSLLVVGTKRQAKEIIEAEIARVKNLLKEANKENFGKLYYITQRWIGGVLTNFTEISRNFKKLNDLKDKTTNEEEKSKYTKKEIGLFEKEIQRLESFYNGISQMQQKPDALFIIDSHLENLAVREALNMGVETIAIVDTNADPFVIDHPIPANDDAVGSIKLIVSYILDAWVEGIKAQKPPKVEKLQDEKPKTENVKPVQEKNEIKDAEKKTVKKVVKEQPIIDKERIPVKPKPEKVKSKTKEK